MHGVLIRHEGALYEIFTVRWDNHYWPLVADNWPFIGNPRVQKSEPVHTPWLRTSLAGPRSLRARRSWRSLRVRHSWPSTPGQVRKGKYWMFELDLTSLREAEFSLSIPTTGQSVRSAPHNQRNSVEATSSIQSALLCVCIRNLP